MLLGSKLLLHIFFLAVLAPLSSAAAADLHPRGDYASSTTDQPAANIKHTAAAAAASIAVSDSAERYTVTLRAVQGISGVYTGTFITPTAVPTLTTVAAVIDAAAAAAPPPHTSTITAAASTVTHTRTSTSTVYHTVPAPSSTLATAPSRSQSAGQAPVGVVQSSGAARGARPAGPTATLALAAAAVMLMHGLGVF